MAQHSASHAITPGTLKLLLQNIVSSFTDEIYTTPKVDISALASASIDTEQWYAIHNNARSCWIRYADDAHLYGKSNLPTSVKESVTDPDNITAYLFRFVKTDDGYRIQTYDGNFWSTLVDGQTSGAGGGNDGADPKGVIYSIQEINDTPSHFAIADSNAVVLDNNGADYAIAGWGSTLPSEINGNNDWQLFRVQISETLLDHSLFSLHESILQEVHVLLK